MFKISCFLDLTSIFLFQQLEFTSKGIVDAWSRGSLSLSLSLTRTIRLN